MTRKHKQLVRRTVSECLEGRRLFAVVPLDPTFGQGGAAQVQFAAPQSYASKMAIDANGKIVVAGAGFGVSDAEFTQFPLMRFNADGTVDTSFGANGRALPNPDPARRFAGVTDVLRVLPGDINRDGAVNVFDYNVMRPNLNQSGKGITGGDINGDNLVSLVDYNEYRYYLNKTAPV